MARGVVFLVGLALVVGGVAMVWIPAALIVAGLGVMLGVLLDETAAQRERPTT